MASTARSKRTIGIPSFRSEAHGRTVRVAFAEIKPHPLLIQGQTRNAESVRPARFPLPLRERTAIKKAGQECANTPTLRASPSDTVWRIAVFSAP